MGDLIFNTWKEKNMVAAFSNCMDGHIMGFISTENDTFEVTPLTEKLEKIARSSMVSNNLLSRGDIDDNDIKVFYVFKKFRYHQISFVLGWNVT